jgi:adenosine kinase
MIRDLIEGAEILFSNEYEAALIAQKTGWGTDDVLDRVGTWVVTLGGEGVRVQRKGEPSIHVAAVPETQKVEPTGVGDAFRAGFLAALSWGLTLERAAQLGCLLAVYVVERVGTQEYTLHQAAFVQRFRETYGEDAARDIAEHVRTPRP